VRDTMLCTGYAALFYPGEQESIAGMLLEREAYTLRFFLQSMRGFASVERSAIRDQGDPD
jgi:hypothetical protein